MLFQQDSADYPFVSVLMPVRNEATHIARSVTAVLHQNYPVSQIEFIVADGLSDDSTVEIIRGLPDAKRIKIIQNFQRIQSAGMNRALEHARGDIIVRVDGHTIIHPDYVHRCVRALYASGADNVGGSINPVSRTSLGRAISAAGKSSFAIPAAFRVSTKAQYVDTVYMGAWWRTIFDRIGGFDEELAVNEDYELNYRIRRAGGRIFYSPDLCSEYYGQETFAALARQYFRYGRSKPKVVSKHPASIHARHLPAPLLVAAVILGGLLAPLSRETELLWAMTLLAYLTAATFFSLSIGRKNGYMLCLYLPLVFATIHTAWGCGFWAGVIGLIRNRFKKARGSLP